MNAETIFAEALKYDDPAERSNYLDEACGDNRALRTEVESLLTSADDAGSFLEKQPEEIDALLSTRNSDDTAEGDTFDTDSWRELLSHSEHPGALGRLGAYDVLELVGRGGMGVVLRTFDEKLSRVVAIKLLAPELAAQALPVRRFLREARAAAAVSHDHVVSIYAVDDTARPPMIAMEMINGQSLQQKIDATGPLDVKSILRIGMQTAAGLSAAHRQGLVHRDIKPANILLENGIEKVKLTDFGLARAVDDISMTRTGQITGTPQYMSPEQAQGQRIDHRTDLFSLGCVLYSMCTGRAAFRADSAVAVMHRVVHDEPRPIRDVNEEIPHWLCEIVDKLLAKSPDDRFESAAELEQRLEACLAHVQQPDSVALPEPSPSAARVASEASSASSPDDATRHLRFVRNSLGIMGLLSLLWFVANLSLPYNGAIGFGFTMPTLLLSLLTGCLSLCGAWHTMNRSSYGWSLLGIIAALMPVNGPQLLGLGFTIWALLRLMRDDVREAFHDQARNGADFDQPAPTRDEAWRLRIPLPAWGIAILFCLVFLLAGLDGANKLDGRTAEMWGVLTWFLAVVCLTVWIVVSAVRRLTRPTRRAQTRVAPMVLFFGTVVLISGAFMSLWTRFDFSDPFSFRERIARYFGETDADESSEHIPFTVEPLDGQLAFIFEDIAILFDGTDGVSPSSRSKGEIALRGGSVQFIRMNGNAIDTTGTTGPMGTSTFTVNDYTFHFIERATRLRLPQSDGSSTTLKLRDLPRPMTIRIRTDGSFQMDHPGKLPNRDLE